MILTSAFIMGFLNLLVPLTSQTERTSSTVFGFLPHAEVKQFQKGPRDTLQMKIPLCVHSEEMHSLLVPSGSFDVTAEFFLDQVIVRYSDEGSNKRTKEEAVILHRSDYNTECCDETL